jgi:hypothetical protein
LALPQDQTPPAIFLQCRKVLKVAGAVPFQFRNPISSIGFWKVGKLAVVLMPEAAMHEDELLPAREYQIGLSRQVIPMEPVAVPHTMNKPTNEHLRRSVF